jgi:hypothetical protein
VFAVPRSIPMSREKRPSSQSNMIETGPSSWVADARWPVCRDVAVARDRPGKAPAVYPAGRSVPP